MKARLVGMAAVLCGLAFSQRHVVAQADYPVTLDVVVTDKADKPVANLKPEDFKVLDNKQERPISSVELVGPGDENSDPPVTVYLVVDEVNSVYEDISTKQVIDEYIRQAGVQLAEPTSLILVTDANVSFQRKPTRDPKTLTANLAGISGANRSVLNTIAGI